MRDKLDKEPGDTYLSIRKWKEENSVCPSVHPSLHPSIYSAELKKGPTAMDWWRDNFWIILAVAIILVSSGLGLILYCACRQLLRQGKKWEVATPREDKQRDEEKMYENVLNEPSVQLPPLPPRGVLFPEHTFPQETPSEPPATYSRVNKLRDKKTMSIPSYIEPLDDYDDVEIPIHMEKQRF
ncbi:SLP adapter and CSK-interacting membrane protein isoform X1 [Mustela putorius furo]|uniref:SLP adapter and CSK-interacting membrane protein isoform X1 n=2 Tax=Mustela putorius furo TaxID=9669 RepID=A0A8U0V5Y4_MUSPF|nr:SLP adapter and CSK-interacting membrane protein isoform X1 [Mustela putorius furo]